MILQEESAEGFDAIIDPMILIYLSIAVGIFVIFAYNKPELKIFIIPMVGLWFSLFFKNFDIEMLESFFITASSITMLFSILYYQVKVKSKQSLGE